MARDYHQLHLVYATGWLHNVRFIRSITMISRGMWKLMVVVAWSVYIGAVACIAINIVTSVGVM